MEFMLRNHLDTGQVTRVYGNLGETHFDPFAANFYQTTINAN